MCDRNGGDLLTGGSGDDTMIYFRTGASPDVAAGSDANETGETNGDDCFDQSTGAGIANCENTINPAPTNCNFP